MQGNRTCEIKGEMCDASLLLLSYGTIYFECLSLIISHNFSIYAFELTLNGNEEICLSKRNTKAEKCTLKSDLLEIKDLLSEMKSEITRLNTEVHQIKEKLNKSESCEGILLSKHFKPPAAKTLNSIMNQPKTYYHLRL